MNTTSLPKLDAPGAGLPPLEWAVAKFILVPLYLGTTTTPQALERMEQQAASILKTARALSPEHLSKQVLIQRLPGLEDSSRYWSVAMTIQHLVIVNKRIMRTVDSLSNGKIPDGTASTADVKPSPDVVADAVLHQYDESMSALSETLREVDVHRFPSAKSSHPWFGPLNSREWLLFIPFHQRVHEGQLKEIILTFRRPDQI